MATMHRAFVISILVVLGLLGRLDAAPRPVVDTPTHAGETSSQVAALRLQARRTARRNASSRSEDERILDAVLEHYFMLTETLLNRGDRIGDETGSRMVICATTMFDGHGEIEGLLQRFTSGELSSPDAERVRQELVRFTQGVRAGLSRVPMTVTGDPEAIVIELLVPLRTACELASGRQAPDGWWPDQEPTTSRLSEPDVGQVVEIDKLEIEEPLRVQLAAVAVDHRLRASSVALLVALDSHKWMDGSARRALKASLQGAIEQATISREDMDETVRRVIAMKALVDAIGRFAQSPGGRAVATRRSGAIIDILEAWPGQLPPAAPTMAIAETIDILAEARGDQDDGLSRFRSKVHVGLVRQRLAAERRVFDSFVEVAASKAPWTDPGLVVILAEPRHLLEAMRRLRQLEAWREAAERLGPRQASGLVDRMEVLVGAMADERTREDAARALREFERQLALFAWMDGESEIATGRFDPDGRITPGITRALSRWIADWSEGRSSGDAAMTLYRYRRLLDHVRTHQLLDDEGLDRVDAWPAWEVPVDMLAADRNRFSAEVVAFAHALGQGDSDGAHRLQASLEEPYAVLHLAAAVCAEAPRMKGDRGLVILGELTIEPAHDSLFADHRGRFAMIGHALMDIRSLVQQDRLEEAQRLQEWANGEAVRLLRRMDVVPAAPLAVPGMREGDRDIDGGSMQRMR